MWAAPGALAYAAPASRPPRDRSLLATRSLPCSLWRAARHAALQRRLSSARRVVRLQAARGVGLPPCNLSGGSGAPVPRAPRSPLKRCPAVFGVRPLARLRGDRAAPRRFGGRALFRRFGSFLDVLTHSPFGVASFTRCTHPWLLHRSSPPISAPVQCLGAWFLHPSERRLGRVGWRVSERDLGGLGSLSLTGASGPPAA